jgi:hypothetical protein
VGELRQQRAGLASDDVHRHRPLIYGIGFAWFGEMRVYRFCRFRIRRRIGGCCQAELISQWPSCSAADLNPRTHMLREHGFAAGLSSRVSPVGKSRFSSHSRRWLGDRQRETFAFHNTITRSCLFPIEGRHFEMQVPSLRLVLLSDSWSNGEYRAPSHAPHPRPTACSIVIVGATPPSCRVSLMRRSELSELVD